MNDELEMKWEGSGPGLIDAIFLGVGGSGPSRATTVCRLNFEMETYRIRISRVAITENCSESVV